jgi:gluconolactonase
MRKWWTKRIVVFALLGGVCVAALPSHTNGDGAGPSADVLNLVLRDRVVVPTKLGVDVAVRTKPERWEAKKTAVIICDMWDLHHCKRAVDRVKEMAPRMNEVVARARQMGVFIIHAPSSCMAPYENTPMRQRAKKAPTAKNLPKDIGVWCRSIPTEEKGKYPIDQTDGGEDDGKEEHAVWAAKLEGLGRNPKAPWKSEYDVLKMDERDAVSDSGVEIWNMLEERGVNNVILMGVHTNMCVLGRPFGLRQMAKNGKNVVLMRDMTDTMYNPARSPYVSHFRGTDLIVEHIEKYVCPTVTSDQVLGGKPFRFKDDLLSETFVSPDAKLEKIFDDGLVLTEGVAVAPDGMVYFSDITFTHVCKEKGIPVEAGHIWKYNPTTGKSTIFRSPSGMSNGIKFDAAGDMIVAEGADFGGRRVTRTNMKTGKSYILAGFYEGRLFNSPNDLTLDEKGRIYFSDPRYLGHEPVEQPVQAVYRIDLDGSIHRIITDAGKPNGLCVSPDQKTLYVIVNDNGSMGIGRLPKDARLTKGRMALLAYDLATDGSAKFRKTLVDYTPQDGPDGMVSDAEGNLWVAVRDENRPGIYVYSPEGKELAYIKTEIPTNVGFGRGKESKTLYITAGKSLYRIRVNKDGYQLPAKG